MPTLTRGFFAYKSDDGTTYNIGTTLANGSAQSATPVAAGANPAYPRGFKVRHVFGKSSGGLKTRIPVLDPAATMWTAGGSVTKDSVTYTVEGKIGEKRVYRGG